MQLQTGSVIPERERLYVIGDIHGRADLLDRMIEEILRDLDSHPVNDCLTVTIGDYIDRGPDSRGVLDRLASNPFPTEFIPLKGNHEELFEAFCSDPSSGGYWRQLGGLETLHSYGINVSPLMIGKNYEGAAADLKAALPQAHIEFLAALPTWLMVGRYFLCHAGVCPGVPLQAQRPQDLLWIRDSFLKSKADFGKIVVHGHTPVGAPQVKRHRINVDTGAYMTGRLTCAVLERENVRFLSVVI
jgi:serine/threonine protein phosphatase 1